MAVTHPTAVRNEVCDLIVDGLNSGKIFIQESDDSEVATLTFGATAFDDAGAAGGNAAGVATANAITADSSAAGGTAAKGELRESDDTPRALFSVTVTGGGGDMEMSSVSVGGGATVSCSALTYEAMP